MQVTRRNALGAFAGGAAALLLPRKSAAQSFDFAIAPGPFQGTRESLAHYETPKWFRDAKFGIWAHWGPQSGIEAGDWYARNMYMQGSEQYNYHIAHYGHPSKIGYKDLIPNWHADRFDAERLMEAYKRAGAKYFVSMGVHHDNFDLWNSKYTRWNAVKMGPKRDVVGLFRKAALKNGLPFGVTEHLWITYKWFSTSKGSDKTGQWAGVPYDGANPAWDDLYGGCKTVYTNLPWNSDGIPDSWRRHWYQRIKDLVDKYQPDLLYTDGALPFEEYGLNQVANLYNLSAKRHGGSVQAVYTSKRKEDCATGTCVLDVERGVVDQIWPVAWQTDTSVGDWHYRRNDHYKSPKTVVDMLVDIVSRNGNLLLNFPLPNSGELDAIEFQILGELTRWMSVASEGIYGTRPWKIFGEGPSTLKRAGAAGASFNEDKRKDLTAADVRFTTKGNALYAFVMGWPAGEAVVKALGTKARTAPGKITNVELLGYDEKLEWTQGPLGLRVRMPAQKPSEHAIALKVTGALS